MRNDVESGKTEALHILNRLILGGLKMGHNQTYRRMFGRFLSNGSGEDGHECIIRPQKSLIEW